jgi:hypothetical protein
MNAYTQDVKNQLISGAVTGLALGLFLIATRDWSTWTVFVGVLLVAVGVQVTTNYVLFKFAGKKNQ